jgi:hypothetical protein
MGPTLGNASLRAASDCLGGKCPAARARAERLARGEGEDSTGGHDLRRRAARRAREPAAGTRESSGEIGARIALAAQQKELADRFDYVVENDDRERAANECVAIVERELAAPGTMARR